MASEELRKMDREVKRRQEAMRGGPLGEKKKEMAKKMHVKHNVSVGHDSKEYRVRMRHEGTDISAGNKPK